jgi:hypothetical protein
MNAPPWIVHEDKRLYRCPSYYYGPADEPPVRIPLAIENCVVFLAAKHADGKYTLGGTGFWVNRRTSLLPNQAWSFLVTARHIIDKIRKLGCDTIGMRVNLKDGNAIWVDIPIDSSPANRWYTHPTEESCDIAVHIIQPDYDKWNCKAFPCEAIIDVEYIKEYNLGVGDEVYSVGLFSRHAGLQKNIPIVRVGTIASMEVDDLDIHGNGKAIGAYLIESHSIGGLSGSPVFTNLGTMRRAEGGNQFLQGGWGVSSLLGVTLGHWDFPDPLDPFDEQKRVNTGIAIVSPATRILDILNIPHLVSQNLWNEQRILRESAPTLDSSREIIL